VRDAHEESLEERLDRLERELTGRREGRISVQGVDIKLGDAETDVSVSNTLDDMRTRRCRDAGPLQKVEEQSKSVG
jgi:hypothetical protein